MRARTAKVAEAVAEPQASREYVAEAELTSPA